MKYNHPPIQQICIESEKNNILLFIVLKTKKVYVDKKKSSEK